MGYYFYASHMGDGIYASEWDYDYDELYCEQCGDSDMRLGYAENLLEAWALLKDEVETFTISLCDNCKYKKIVILMSSAKKDITWVDTVYMML